MLFSCVETDDDNLGGKIISNVKEKLSKGIEGMNRIRMGEKKDVTEVFL